MPKKLSPEERKRRLHNIRVAYRQAATKGTRQRGKHEVNGECKGHKDGLIYSLRQLNPVALCRDCLGLKNEYASNSDEYIAERRLHNKRRREQYAAMKRGQQEGALTYVQEGASRRRLHLPAGPDGHGWSLGLERSAR